MPWSLYRIQQAYSLKKLYREDPQSSILGLACKKDMECVSSRRTSLPSLRCRLQGLSIPMLTYMILTNSKMYEKFVNLLSSSVLFEHCDLRSCNYPKEDKYYWYKSFNILFLWEFGGTLLVKSMFIHPWIMGKTCVGVHGEVSPTRMFWE